MSGKLQKFIERYAKALDFGLRHLDFIWNRTYGGLLQAFVGTPGYPPMCTLLAYWLVFFVIYGPSPRWRGLGALLLLTISWLTIYLGARVSARRHGVFALVTVAALIVCLVTWLLAPSAAREADPSPYHHVLIPFLALGGLFVALVPRWLADRLVSDYQTSYPQENWLPLSELLPRAELFVRPRDPDFTLGQVWRGLVSTPIYTENA